VAIEREKHRLCNFIHKRVADQSDREVQAIRATRSGAKGSGRTRCWIYN
jgi:hypothetical protein